MRLSNRRPTPSPSPSLGLPRDASERDFAGARFDLDVPAAGDPEPFERVLRQSESASCVDGSGASEGEPGHPSPEGARRSCHNRFIGQSGNRTGVPPKRAPREDESDESVFALAPGLTIEFTGDAFFLVSRGEGHDLTLALEPSVAFDLAEFILRRQRAALGQREATHEETVEE